VSEEDEGQADAINKGLQKSTGAIEAYLNSDDIFLPGALSKVGAAMSQNCEHDWVVGEAFYFSNDIEDPERIFPANAPCMPDLIFGLSFPQQSTFWRSTARQAVGFDTSYQFCMDVNFFCKLLDRHGPPKVFQEKWAGFRVHDDAKSTNWSAMLRKDTERIAEYWLSRYSGLRRLQLWHRLRRWRTTVAFMDRLNLDGKDDEAPGVINLLKRVGKYPPGALNRQVLGAIRRLLLSPDTAGEGHDSHPAS
jgi:glycosyltransferase involved in cell wall biosynthesis